MTDVLIIGLNVALALAGGVGGWALKSMADRIDALAHGHETLRVHLAERYLPRSDHRDALDGIMRMLRRIENKLDTKADKPPGKHFVQESDFGEFARRRDDAV